MTEPFFNELVKRMLNSQETKKAINEATLEKLSQLLASDKLPKKEDLAAVLGKCEGDENSGN